MKKLVLAGLMFVVASMSALAEEIVLSGDAGQGGGASLNCSPTSEGVQFAYNPSVLVRTKSEGTATGFTKQRGTGGKDVYVLSSIPNGTNIYIMGLAKDWGSMSRNIDKVNVAKALASGVFQGNDASMSLKYQDKDGNKFSHAMLNAIAVLPNGTHAWAGVEGTQYSVQGPKGPFLLVPKTCDAPSKNAKQLAIEVEGRK